ncbi:hypothetical protein L6E12_04920 [Actinokineospora sp. PR83]|uniref:hypothetical protein n=1 Tax=Actinokineospora sp. PR83 TaxID=2884908 RepID=UPI001F3EFE20|nr:hypothetical protein [Actinokineospora sp. PR83]MCG8915132.1 hypothetical protein [Actinokineospora sp. PR83]
MATATTSTSSPAELRNELVARGWDLDTHRAGNTITIGAHRTGEGYREFMVMHETGHGEILLGRWIEATDLVWIRMANGWQETIRLLDTFPDEPTVPWLPAHPEELLTAALQRQATLLADSTPADTTHRPGDDTTSTG